MHRERIAARENATKRVRGRGGAGYDQCLADAPVFERRDGRSAAFGDGGGGPSALSKLKVYEEQSNILLRRRD